MKRAEIIRLGQEILRDFEARDMDLGVLMMKSHTFAKLIGNKFYEKYLDGECVGHNYTDDTETYLKRVGRLAEGENAAVVAPLAQLEHHLKMNMEVVATLRAFQPSGQYALLHLQQQESKILNYIKLNNKYNTIITKVKADTYQLIAYHVSEAAFSQSSANFFYQYQAKVDARIASTASAAFEKIPSVFERLGVGDREAVSHALTSCRRIMEAFADAVFPPRAELVPVGGQELNCAAGKIKNQIQAFIWLSTTSESRRERLNRNWRLLYDRVCAGVHSDVTPTEAQALVLNTYLILGELVEFDPPPIVSPSSA